MISGQIILTGFLAFATINIFNHHKEIYDNDIA